MKKCLLLVLLAIGVTSYVNAQWTVYDASVLPGDATPAWGSGDIRGDGAHVNINPVTNTMHFSAWAEANPDQGDRTAYRQPAGVAFDDTATWVFRTRIDELVDSADFGIQFELQGRETVGFRANLKIGMSSKGGFIKLDGGSAPAEVTWPADSSLTTYEHHIYRITMEADSFKVYVDEAPVPVIKIQADQAAQDRCMRFGWFTNGVSAGQLNAMAWDSTGAYAPGEGTPLPAEFETNLADIIFTVQSGGNWMRDFATISFLRDLGYNVDTMLITNTVTLLTKGSAAIDALNAADLVVIGRSGSSSAYHLDRGRDIWNNDITVPILNIHPYTTREYGSNHLLAWVNNDCSHYQTVPRGDTLSAIVNDKADPIFANSVLDGDTMIWTKSRDSYARLDANTLGDVLVEYKGESPAGMMVVRWEPGQKYFKGAPVLAWAAAPRTLFGFGNDQDGIVNYWNLLENAQYVLRNEIARLIGTPYVVYAGSNDATLSDITVSEGTLAPVFAPATLAYDLDITDYVGSVTVTGVANEGAATVISPATVEIPRAGMVDSTVTVTCISSDASDTIEYEVTISVAPLEISVALITPETNGDQNQYTFLTENGIDVTRMWLGNLGTITRAMIDSLNGFDVVIIGRAGNSTDIGLNTAAGVSVVNDSVTAPVISNSPFHNGSGRLDWFNGSRNNQTVEGGTRIAHTKMADDPVYANTTWAADTIVWSYLPDSYISTYRAFNGDTLAYEVINDSTISPLYVRFILDSAFYTGGAQKVNAPRTYFGFGNDGITNVYNYFPLTHDVQAAYLGEVLSIAGLNPIAPIYYVSADASMASMTTVPADTLDPAAFSAAVLDYTLRIPKVASNSVTITFVPTSSLATVTGNGTFDLTADTTTFSVYARAENTRRGDTYHITVIQIQGDTTNVPQQLLANDIRLFPNPSNNVVTIEGLDVDATVSIINSVGQEVISRIATSNTMTINIADIEKGVYFVNIRKGKAGRNIVMIKN